MGTCVYVQHLAGHACGDGLDSGINVIDRYAAVVGPRVGTDSRIFSILPVFHSSPVCLT